MSRKQLAREQRSPATRDHYLGPDSIPGNQNRNAKRNVTPTRKSESLQIRTFGIIRTASKAGGYCHSLGLNDTLPRNCGQVRAMRITGFFTRRARLAVSALVLLCVPATALADP